MRTVIVAVQLLTAFFAQAQQTKTIEATRQDWSGGNAGRHGSNYRFVVRFEGITPTIQPDTLWIDGEAIALENSRDRSGSYKISERGGRTYCEIAVRIARNEYHHLYGPDGRKQPKARPPINYKGVALLRYKKNGQADYYVIEKILKHAPPVNYP